MGQILTFYSYKGGAGRSMALANIAVLLAQKNKKVLMIDWDLDAPGLEYYFKENINLEKAARYPGVIDLINSYNNKEQVSDTRDWHDCLIRFRVMGAELNLITSGQKKRENQNVNYFSLVRNLDVDNFYEERRGGNYIEKLRNEWKAEYDFVLIDSRTGITDIGGICTIQFPDILFLLFNSNEQSLAGIAEVAKKVGNERKKLPFDRYSLIVYPVASRFDSQAEFKVSQEWLNKIAINLKDCFSNWLPQNIDVKKFVEATKIPYSPYFSFGEKLPVIEHGLSDPTGLGFAYETISSIIADKFENVENVLRSRGLAGPETFKDKDTSRTKISGPAPRNGHKVSQRGLLSIAMLILSMGAFGISAVSGAKMVFDVLGNISNSSVVVVIAQIIVIGLAYAVGWVTALVAIRVYGNLILPILINWCTWGSLLVVCYLYLAILKRMYAQPDDLGRFIKYLMIMAGGLGALIGLHLIVEDHDLRPFSVPLLLINLSQLGMIVFRYMFDTADVKVDFLWKDLVFFFMMMIVSIAMLAHWGILGPLSMWLTNRFDRRSNSIRSQD